MTNSLLMLTSVILILVHPSLEEAESGACEGLESIPDKNLLYGKTLEVDPCGPQIFKQCTSSPTTNGNTCSTSTKDPKTSPFAVIVQDYNYTSKTVKVGLMLPVSLEYFISAHPSTGDGTYNASSTKLGYFEDMVFKNCNSFACCDPSSKTKTNVARRCKDADEAPTKASFNKNFYTMTYAWHPPPGYTGLVLFVSAMSQSNSVHWENIVSKAIFVSVPPEAPSSTTRAPTTSQAPTTIQLSSTTQQVSTSTLPTNPTTTPSTTTTTKPPKIKKTQPPVRLFPATTTKRPKKKTTTTTTKAPASKVTSSKAKIITKPNVTRPNNSKAISRPQNDLHTGPILLPSPKISYRDKEAISDEEDLDEEKHVKQKEKANAQNRKSPLKAYSPQSEESDQPVQRNNQIGGGGRRPQEMPEIHGEGPSYASFSSVSSGYAMAYANANPPAPYYPTFHLPPPPSGQF